MCLGVPGVVVKVEGDTALVDFGGLRMRVDAFLVPDLKPGDYVIVHAGAIISRISEEEAMEIFEAWRQLLEVMEDLRPRSARRAKS